ncbi:hypothetical protein GCM10009727_51780 [Actinomadura napierensis]|uniref:Uncharacterized protein n=1 Tax=Actinomadura napierensis TaxID=267854 RepID=A0ABP5LP07_9ACTN
MLGPEVCRASQCGKPVPNLLLIGEGSLESFVRSEDHASSPFRTERVVGVGRVPSLPTFKILHEINAMGNSDPAFDREQNRLGEGSTARPARPHRINYKRLCDEVQAP